VEPVKAPSRNTSPESIRRFGESKNQEEAKMASSKQSSAARKNIKKAANAAKKKRTIAHLPKSVRTALGKKGALAARRKRLS
jgi:hypothetical protein